MRYRLLIWSLYLIGWSAALLTPEPTALARTLLPAGYSLIACKILHVGAYALLAVLSGWLRAPGRLRGLVFAFMVTHALITEYLQRFVATRTPSWRDAGLNLIGLLIGTALTWKWWRTRSDAAFAEQSPAC